LLSVGVFVVVGLGKCERVDFKVGVGVVVAVDIGICERFK
jgi:hypothetical protein